MTEKELRGKYTSAFLSLKGKKEADGSFKSIIDTYNSISPLPVGYKLSYSEPWCAACVSAVAQMVGMTSIIFPECSCDRMIALYKKAERWMEDDNYLPSVGDIVFYDWDDNGVGDCTGASDHVGAVLEVSGSTIRVIEGNYSDSVYVRNISRNGRYIRGYGLPDYASLSSKDTDTADDVSDEDKAEAETTPAEPEVDTATIILPVIKYGSMGTAVFRMQSMLIMDGYHLPIYGADGEWGDETDKAFKKYVAAHSLSYDECVQPVWQSFFNE